MNYKIKIKYAPEAMFPANAIEKAFYEDKDRGSALLETTDGVTVRPQFIWTLNTKGGWFDAELEKYSQEHFKMSFEHFKSIWFGRLGMVDDYFHYVRFEKV